MTRWALPAILGEFTAKVSNQFPGTTMTVPGSSGSILFLSHPIYIKQYITFQIKHWPLKLSYERHVTKIPLFS